MVVSRTVARSPGAKSLAWERMLTNVWFKAMELMVFRPYELRPARMAPSNYRRGVSVVAPI